MTDALRSRLRVGRASAATRGPWGIIAGTWLLWLFVGAYAITPASVLPLVMRDLGINEVAGAWIVSAPMVAATVLGLPVGMYLDRVDNWRIIVAGTATLFVASVWGWFAGVGGNLLSLLASRLLGGVMLVTLWVASTNVVSRAVASERRGTAVAVFATGYPAGYALGQLAVPVLTAHFGWPAAFAIFGVLSLLASTGIRALRPGDLLDDAEGEAGAPSDLPRSADFRRVFTHPGVWSVCLMSFLVYALYMIFNSWVPTYLSRTFGLPLARSGALAALFAAVGLLARPAGGMLSDRVFGCRRRPVVGLSFLGTLAAVAGMVASTRLALLVAVLVGAGFFVQLQIGLLYTYVQDFVETNVASTAISVVSVTGWFGSFAAPVAVGVLIEQTRTYALAFGLAAALAVGGLATVWRASEAGEASGETEARIPAGG